MTTQDFLNTLRSSESAPLRFCRSDTPLVPEGYHVTEVKAYTIESMDCGGKANFWRETVIQLMDGTPEEARSGFMTSKKFLDIYDQVAAHVPIAQAAELRIEYGNASAPALLFLVAKIAVKEGSGAIVVELEPPGVTCKATGASSAAGECCGPSCKPELIRLA